jgi:hypothetical protein
MGYRDRANCGKPAKSSRKWQGVVLLYFSAFAPDARRKTYPRFFRGVL